MREDIIPPPVTSLTNMESVEWERFTNHLILPPSTHSASSTDGTRIPRKEDTSGAATAMTKLAVIIAHQEASLKLKEKKADQRTKAWKWLPAIQRNVILLGGVEEDGTIPGVPTEEILAVLGYQSSAQVDQYLKYSMVGYNICPEPGL